ncbi:L,D-transpeptidase [Mobiluncus mulieris]|uniref:L,D-transpeptidase n=1 Tax=Mobiluncus mulieris TaxID=2052 RepID=UPI00242E9B18|nr:L,D-transpeptidase [Mobiluncus mulieris]
MNHPSHLIPQHRRVHVWESPSMWVLAMIVAIVIVASWQVFRYNQQQSDAIKRATAAASQEITSRQVVVTLAGVSGNTGNTGSVSAKPAKASPQKTQPSEIRATPAQLRSWVRFQPDRSQKGKVRTKVQFQPEKVAAWMTQAAAQLKRAPEKGSRQVDATGHLVRLLKDPVSGVKIKDLAKSTSQLMKSLQDGKREVKIELHTESAPGGFDDTVVPTPPLAYQAQPTQVWVDVNLSNHTTAVYRGNQPVYGPIPMVNGHPQAPTRQGVFQVYAKVDHQIMRGIGWNGPYEEAAPWIAYFSGDYALHGAPWRHTFVWEPEKGSHGCINMAVADAKQVFDLVSIGTVVVVHQ